MDRTDSTIRTMTIFFGLFVILLVVFLIVSLFAYPATATTFDGELVKKFVDDGYMYLVLKNISTGETEVFENYDEPLFWEFDSNDFLKELELGKSYSFKVIGWRAAYWSLHLYRSIISYEEIP